MPCIYHERQQKGETGENAEVIRLMAANCIEPA